MGTHPSGPALIDGTQIPLSSWLRENPTAVGYVPSGYTADSLPFLLKVLSIRTALSIQVID
jgi:mannose-6-phosphate isomerase